MSFSELCTEFASLNQLKSPPADYQYPSMSNSDFGELVWENGQIVIKGGQFTQVSTVPNMASFINSKTGIAGTSLGLGDADTNPWFYNLDAMLHHEATSGVTSSGFPSHTNISAPHSLSNPVPYSGSRVSSIADGNGALKYGVESGSLGDQLSEMRLQKKDKQVQVENFNFYRQIGRAKNEIESVEAGANDSLKKHETTAAKDGMLEDTNGQNAATARKCLPIEPVEKQANAVVGEDGLNVNQVNCANAHMESGDAKNIREPTVAPPSLCSENSGLRASNNPTYHLKRKHINEEDCESSSEDAEGESVCVRKAGCKRNRAAEVHNFMERKRREKINDKMRALQELVPNCNKVDKATMLDEAIEYLRVLQYQVQMMSMRSQMCTSSIMPQPGLQQLQAHQFMPMGFGMGMGFQPGTLNTFPGYPLQAVSFPCPSNPPTQQWNAVQGIPMSMHGLSMPMHGTQHNQIPRTSAEDPNSKDSHAA